MKLTPCLCTSFNLLPKSRPYEKFIKMNISYNRIKIITQQESFGSLLDSLEKIVDNECSDVDDEIVNKIFNEFPYLELADYEG